MASNEQNNLQNNICIMLPKRCFSQFTPKLYQWESRYNVTIRYDTIR